MIGLIGLEMAVSVVMEIECDAVSRDAQSQLDGHQAP